MEDIWFCWLQDGMLWSCIASDSVGVGLLAVRSPAGHR